MMLPWSCMSAKEEMPDAHTGHMKARNEGQEQGTSLSSRCMQHRQLIQWQSSVHGPAVCVMQTEVDSETVEHNGGRSGMILSSRAASARLRPCRSGTARPAGYGGCSCKNSLCRQASPPVQGHAQLVIVGRFHDMAAAPARPLCTGGHAQPLIIGRGWYEADFSKTPSGAQQMSQSRAQKA